MSRLASCNDYDDNHSTTNVNNNNTVFNIYKNIIIVTQYIITNDE